MTENEHNRVLVTGGASGLGREIAVRFAQEGYRVCIADLNEERAQETISLIDDTPGEAFFEKCDVTSPQDWARTLVAMEDVWAGTDILINNAGVASGGPFNWLSEQDWHWVMGINFYGVLYGCQAFVPQMIERKAGHIVNVASMAGVINPPGMSNYNVSKAAVISLSETLAVELKPHGIGVTCVCPSFFKTNLGESLRTPDAGTQAAMNKLMDHSSELSAADIADVIFRGVMAGEFMVMPHEKARMAAEYKAKDMKGHMAMMEPLAQQVLERAQRKED